MQEHPAVRLAQIVTRLFDAGDDPNIPNPARESALRLARRLRLQLLVLLERKMKQPTPEHFAILEEMARVGAALEPDPIDAPLLAIALQGAGELADAIDRLLQVA
jgi:hypothetical protein